MFRSYLENIEKGKKSIAFNVTFEPKDKTLSEEDIEKIDCTSFMKNI